MFKVLATVCFLSVGAEKQDLCMSGFIPMTTPIPTAQMCVQSIKEIAEYVDEDFKTRNISMNLKCVKEINNESINI
tara:strand:- start:366 stop:593 length:228 start_codon:yes stop_codon:yes gene_type:complete